MQKTLEILDYKISIYESFLLDKEKEMVSEVEEF
jgi:hypothetical protein